MTERIYYTDPYAAEFDATVVNVEPVSGDANRHAVVLDRTAFYPESGGQMADRGRIATASVLDVQVDGGDGDAPGAGHAKLQNGASGDVGHCGCSFMG